MIPKFRAWDKRKQLMREVAVLQFNKNGNVSGIDYWKTPYDLQSIHANYINVMQSTGLKDKNGVEIFEGDCFIKIFRTIETPTGKNGIEKSVGIVKFHEGAFQVHIDGWGYELLSEVAQPHIYGANDDYWENVVIGNIYENPELLEVEG